MSDQPENLTLVYLRRLDAKMDKMMEWQEEHGRRLSRMEISMASLRRDQANDVEARAETDVRVDRLRERLERIEKRLDILPA